jgi:hypothetical protein
MGRFKTKRLSGEIVTKKKENNQISKTIKLILILIFQILFTSTFLYAFDIKYEKTTLELSGGYAGVAMSAVNKAMDNFIAFNSSIGNSSNEKHFTNGDIFSLDVDSYFLTSIGRFSTTLKYENIPLYHNDGIYYYPNGNIYYRIIETYHPVFFTTGIKYWIDFNNNLPNYSMFFGGDIGVNSTNGIFNQKDYEIGYENNYQYVFNNSFNCSGNVEVGAQIMILERIGFRITCGYKIAPGVVNEICTKHERPALVGKNDFFAVDYSGSYVKLGLLAMIFS